MTSPKQIAANQSNAQKSTGPTTFEGKIRASINATRHSLTGQVSLMPDEDRTAFNAFCAELVESLAPDTAMERQLAQSIAEDSWRLNRGRAVETNIFALGHSGPQAEVDTVNTQVHAAVTAARVFLTRIAQFQLVTLYAQRTNRDIRRNMDMLHALQTRRETRRNAELDEAARLRHLNRTKGLSYDDQADRKADGSTRPVENGFVFSNTEIDCYLSRKRRLHEASLIGIYGDKPARK